MNTAYAFLAEQADAADRAAVPVYLAAGMKPDDITTRRSTLDDWLDGPYGRQAADERALVRYLSA